MHPDFAKNYNSEDKPVSTGSIIVVSNDKYRVISESDYYDSENGQFSIESAITSAIQFVDAEELPAVYFVTGHGELNGKLFFIVKTDVIGKLQCKNYKSFRG